MTPTNRVIVAGSRSLEDYDLVCKTLDEFLADMPPSNTVIVSGTARGADMLGERYAKEHGYEVMPFPAKWRDEKGNYDPSAGYARNAQMAAIATHLVAFMHVKGTKGTRNMIATASGRGIKIKVVRFEAQP